MLCGNKADMQGSATSCFSACAVWSLRAQSVVKSGRAVAVCAVPRVGVLLSCMV